MIALNLTANGNEQIILKDYLEQNASDILADKINNGVRIIKDGKQLINKKTLDGFMKYACDEAKKLAGKGGNSACIEDKAVFGWAIHYFEEDSIEGTLFNADGTEYNPQKPKYEPKTAPPVTPPKPQPKPQMSLFDLMESNESEKTAETPNEIVATKNESAEVDDEDDGFTEEEQQEILREIAEEEAKQNKLKSQVITKPPKGSPLYLRYELLQKQYPDSIIAMRLGDFYEVFGESAILLAKELDLTLTGRDCGLESRVPMVGFPYHVADNYIRKICEKHKLAVAENSDNIKLLQIAEQETDEDIDTETGEILSEAEMRKFDGDVEEPRELLNNSNNMQATATVPETIADNKIFKKLSELLGNILIGGKK